MAKKKKVKTVIRSRESKDRQYNDQKDKGQNGNQKPKIKEGQTIQWPKRKRTRRLITVLTFFFLVIVLSVL
jgi:hypothetical protein